MGDGDLLRRTRESSGLSVGQAAELIGLQSAVLGSIERGEAPANTLVLDNYARAFGLTLGELMAGAQTAETPSSVLFRSLRDAGPSFHALASSGALLTLGDFLRCVRAVVELRALEGETRDWRQTLDRLSAPEPPRDVDLLSRAEALAARVRHQLGLGQAPVPSMKAIFDQLGIDLFFVTPDELDVDIDAGSTVTPAPAVLVNLVGGAQQWWRTRMTLAHELCHLIFDRGSFGIGDEFVALSPSDRKKIPLPAGLELIEKRARAFAAHFLVPRPELTRVLHGRDATSEGAVTAVCQHFKVGRVSAVNQLRNIGAISDDARTGMLGRKPANVLPDHHPDALATSRVGLRSGVVTDLVLRSVSTGRLGRHHARLLLDLAASDMLPEGAGLSDDQRAPLVDAQTRVEKVVMRYLLSQVRTADCHIEAVSLIGSEWLVQVSRGETACGSIRLGEDFQVIVAQVETPGE